MASVRPSRSLVFVALGVVACSTLGFAEEEPPARAARVEAVAYDVFHGDSIHRMGYYVREIHVPSRGFAFYVANGELRVFRPEQGRYALPGETLKLAIPGGESIELPVSHVPGTEPKRVGPLCSRVATLARGPSSD